MTNPISRRVLKFAENLRFPQLFAITATVFALDVLIPDMIPFADEILLGLGSLVLGNLRRDKGTRGPKRH